ncbi:MAG: hypothetical protein WAS23_14745 [Dokdonella sp.]|uniref:hypothetical protein n=1 Tax=Dokdonella sp. TaxID=2291710 RepID=UPI002D147704|nr:hypothetical protein [Dokdonella sp.]HOX70921.1 hypothetical protein [Dokdonella sp.]HPG93997.1 hypothetical protein [Dokdonella sp.]HPN80413.1 hypothetical protein [Dokdonella sp.]
MFVFRTGLRQRNPLLRLIGGVLGLLAVLGVLALGMFAFVALFVGGTLWFLVHVLLGKRQPARRPRASAADNGVIDGEFVVVHADEARMRAGQTVIPVDPRVP